MDDLNPGAGCIQRVRKILEEELGKPGKWELLFDKDKNLITGKADRLETKHRLSNPLFAEAGQMGKPVSAYVDESAKTRWPSIPVLGEQSIINAFGSAGCSDVLPGFYLAGEPLEFRINPAEARIGILVAGGNAAGLNMVIDSIVKRITALASTYKGEKSFRPAIYGYIGGYTGLREGIRFEGQGPNQVLTLEDTDPRSGEPCVFLKTLRGRSVKIGTPEADDELKVLAEGVKRDNLQVLFVIGGNGTFTWASELYKTLKGQDYDIALVGGPKTMDWDINFADATFGFRTAVDNALEFIHTVHWEAETQDRIAVIELFGANSGFVALHAGFLSGVADYIMIPEFNEILRQQLPKDISSDDLQNEIEGRLFAHLERRLERRKHAVLVVAEGALLEFKHGDREQREQAFTRFVQRVKARFPNYGLVDVRPRHLIRGTPPCSYDLDLAKYTGYLMADTALAGFTNCAVQLWQGNHVLVPLPTAVAHLGQVQPWSSYFWYMAQRYLLPVDK